MSLAKQILKQCDEVLDTPETRRQVLLAIAARRRAADAASDTYYIKNGFPAHIFENPELRDKFYRAINGIQWQEPKSPNYDPSVSLKAKQRLAAIDPDINPYFFNTKYKQKRRGERAVRLGVGQSGVPSAKPLPYGELAGDFDANNKQVLFNPAQSRYDSAFAYTRIPKIHPDEPVVISHADGNKDVAISLSQRLKQSLDPITAEKTISTGWSTRGNPHHQIRSKIASHAADDEDYFKTNAGNKEAAEDSYFYRTDDEGNVFPRYRIFADPENPARINTAITSQIKDMADNEQDAFNDDVELSPRLRPKEINGKIYQNHLNNQKRVKKATDPTVTKKPQNNAVNRGFAARRVAKELGKENMIYDNSLGVMVPVQQGTPAKSVEQPAEAQPTTVSVNLDRSTFSSDDAFVRELLKQLGPSDIDNFSEDSDMYENIGKKLNPNLNTSNIQGILNDIRDHLRKYPKSEKDVFKPSLPSRFGGNFSRSTFNPVRVLDKRPGILTPDNGKGITSNTYQSTAKGEKDTLINDTLIRMQKDPNRDKRRPFIRQHPLSTTN